MNQFDARPRFNGSAWFAVFKCADQAEYRHVQNDAGEVLVFESRAAAQLAADRALRRYLNGNPRRFGEKPQAISVGPVFRPGKRPVEVERKARA